MGLELDLLAFESARLPQTRGQFIVGLKLSLQCSGSRLGLDLESRSRAANFIMVCHQLANVVL